MESYKLKNTSGLILVGKTTIFDDIVFTFNAESEQVIVISKDNLRLEGDGIYRSRFRVAERILSDNEVQIGNQVWMRRNLDVDKFRNGDPVPHARTDEEWLKAAQQGEPAWCYYDNSEENGKIYGRLYNWYAVNDPRCLAPEGWHIPDEVEWEALVAYKGGTVKANELLISNTDCNDIEVNDKNEEVGFAGLLGGFRFFNENGVFYLGEEQYCSIWSSTEISLDNSRMIDFNKELDEEEEVTLFSPSCKGFGYYVRCIRN